MQHIFRSLPEVFKDIDGGKFANEAVVFAAWRKIAGETLGQHAVPMPALVALHCSPLVAALARLVAQRLGAVVLALTGLLQSV